jgi:hypothetical protein
MAPKVKEIFVDLVGQPSVKKQPAKPSEAIVWIPESELETITVTFLGGKTPFYTGVLQAPCPGGSVGALVIGPDDTYTYQISVDGVRTSSSGAADPEIIIDSGSKVPPKRRNRSSKAVQKKSADKKPAGGKKAGPKKGAKKKAAKKR